MTTAARIPEAGQLVRVRGQQWVVADVNESRQPVDELAASRVPGRTLVQLTSVSDDDLGEALTLVWEVEPGREIVPATRLPEVTETGWDDPQRLGAFLDAVRWGTVASADTRTLQAPFRSGASIEEYQLEPVARTLAMPRVNLLIADDVGLGKSIEARMVVQEMLLRHRARRVLVICPASLTLKWREEMAEKFGLDFTILDTAVATARELARFTGQHLIAPQAILTRAYMEQIFAGLREAGLPVFHVVLDADEDILCQRIQDSPEAQAWRLAHLAEYRASRSWMIPAADLVVDTGHQIPSAAAHQIADALPGL